MREPIKREGARLVANIPANARIKLLSNGRCVVACPDRPPYIIEPDGTETPIVPKPDDGHGVVRL